MKKDQIVSFNTANVDCGISAKGYGRTYFAKKDFKVGDTVMEGIGKVIDHQTSHISVQIDKNKHYLPVKWTGKYWNHSCNPNTYVQTRPDGFPNLIATKKIKKGEEITFAYWMTEFAWSKNADEKHIKCRCGQKNCKGHIYAFSELPQKDQEKVLKTRHCSRYLLNT